MARSWFGLCLLVFSLACLTARPARAQPDYDVAGKQFAAGQEGFAARRFHTAALHFQASYDITKVPAVLFNVGESWENAGEAGKALVAYRAYLVASPTAQDRADVEKRIARLDDKKAAPLADQSVAGDKDEAGKIIASGSPAPLAPEPSVAADMATPAAEAAPPPAPPAAVVEPAPKPLQIGLLEEHPASRLRVAAWSSVAATLALLTTGAILGLASQSRGDEITRRLAYVDSTGQPLQFDAAAKNDFANLRNEGKVYNGISAGFYTAACAMAVVTTTLFLVDWRKGKKAEKISAAPMVGASAAGFVAGGSF